MVHAARWANEQDGQSGRGEKGAGGGLDIDELIEKIDECIFEVSRGDITKHEIIGQQPGDLFFKWLRWMRREKKQQMEWDAVLHGVKIDGSGNYNSTSSGNERKSDIGSKSMAEVAGNFGVKMDFKRVKVSKEEKERQMEAMKRNRIR